MTYRLTREVTDDNLETQVRNLPGDHAEGDVFGTTRAENLQELLFVSMDSCATLYDVSE